MNQPLIELSNIWMKFRNREVLTGINLQVNPGEIVTLIGPNGAGKTTSLRFTAMKIVGVLLITSLMIIPAATAQRLARTPEQMVIVSALLGILGVSGGLAASWYLDTPAAPSVVVASFLLFFNHPVDKKVDKKKVIIKPEPASSQYRNPLEKPAVQDFSCKFTAKPGKPDEYILFS